MSSKGQSKRLKNGLTLKQNKFKNIIVKQIRSGKNPNGTAAALQIYDTTDPNTAHVIASENLRHPTIKKSIDEEMRAVGLSSEKLLKNVGRIANHELDPSEKIDVKHVLNANLSLLKLLNGPKQPNSGHGNNYTFINLGFSEAKKELDKMNSQASEFLSEADVVEE